MHWLCLKCNRIQRPIGYVPCVCVHYFSIGLKAEGGIYLRRETLFEHYRSLEYSDGCVTFV